MISPAVASAVDTLWDKRIECVDLLDRFSMLEAFRRLTQKVRYSHNNLTTKGQQLAVGTFLVRHDKEHQHLLDYINKVHQESALNSTRTERVERYIVEYSKESIISSTLTSNLKPLGDHSIMNTEAYSSNKLNKYQDQLVTQVTLVNGVDASTLTEQQFIQRIQAIQKEIAGFSDLPTSKHVDARVKALKSSLVELVELMDKTLAA